MGSEVVRNSLYIDKFASLNISTQVNNLKVLKDPLWYFLSLFILIGCT